MSPIATARRIASAVGGSTSAQRHQQGAAGVGVHGAHPAEQLGSGRGRAATGPRGRSPPGRLGPVRPPAGPARPRGGSPRTGSRCRTGATGGSRSARRFWVGVDGEQQWTGHGASSWSGPPQLDGRGRSGTRSGWRTGRLQGASTVGRMAARRARVRDITDIARRLRGRGRRVQRPAGLRVHGKVFVFFRGPRKDAVDPDTGELMEDVVCFTSGTSPTRRRSSRVTARFTRHRTSTATGRCCCASGTSGW